jgi:hypothetical protein
MVLSVFNCPQLLVNRIGLDLELSQILIIGHVVHRSLLEAVCGFNAIFPIPELIEGFDFRVKWLFAGSITRNLVRKT